MVTCILLYTPLVYGSAPPNSCPATCPIQRLSKRSGENSRKAMRHPACPVVFSAQERPHLFRECMPGCHFHQRIIEGAEHTLTTPICSMQNPVSKEMPWVCPGLSKNFVQLFLLLGLMRIHSSMHGVTRLIRISSRPLGVSGGLTTLAVLSQLIFTNEFPESLRVQCGYLSRRRASHIG